MRLYSSFAFKLEFIFNLFYDWARLGIIVLDHEISITFKYLLIIFHIQYIFKQIFKYIYFFVLLPCECIYPLCVIFAIKGYIHIRATFAWQCVDRFHFHFSLSVFRFQFSACLRRTLSVLFNYSHRQLFPWMLIEFAAVSIAAVCCCRCYGCAAIRVCFVWLVIVWFNAQALKEQT